MSARIPRTYLRLTFPVLLFISCMLLISSYTDPGKEKVHSSSIDEVHSMPLVGQYLSLESIEAVYQLPTPLESIQGVLFVAHGCSHSATDWWPKSSSCTKCTGLPIEMSIVREAVYTNKFAVIAISSLNRVHKCWNGKDVPRVQEAVKYFYKNIIPGKNVSFHALGASSGGGFVGFLSQQTSEIPVSSLCVQISSVGGEKSSTLPPALFILMSRDEHTLNHVKTITAPAISKSSVLVTSPKEIRPDYFSSKSNKLITAEESRAIHAAFSEGKIIDEKNFLIEDPRSSEWRETVKKAVPTITERDSLVADQSAISELLNVAWDLHEITDEYLPEVFAWFKENKQ